MDEFLNKINHKNCLFVYTKLADYETVNETIVFMGLLMRLFKILCQSMSFKLPHTQNAIFVEFCRKVRVVGKPFLQGCFRNEMLPLMISPKW